MIQGVVRVGKKPRRLWLFERTPYGQFRIAITRSNRRGSFVFQIPAGEVYGPRKLWVYAPYAGELLAVGSAWRKVKIIASPVGDWNHDWDRPEPPIAGAPDPAGSATDYSWLFGDHTSRWNPCQVIEWVYNPTGSYSTSLDDMKRAFARVSGLTGLRFKYVGETAYVHYTDQPFPVDVDIAVAWANEVEVDRLAGPAVGVGGGRGRYVTGADVDLEIYQGWVVFDVEGVIRPGFDTQGPPSWGQVMSHELLHALGLGHAASNDQLMYPSLGYTNHRFGAGDVAGMKRVGADQGCLDSGTTQ